MIKLHRIQLTRAQLDRVPSMERRLLILVAHAANEINTLSKLFHFAASSASDGIAGHAERAQALVLGRVLTGKIYEFWKLLQASYFGTQLARDYQSLLDDESRGALDSLKRYFGRDNLIAIVRNKFAFHYSADQVDAGYAALVEGDPLEVYLAQHNGNTLFTFAETIAGRALLEGIHAGDPDAAFGALIRETSDAVGFITEVAGGIMDVCIQRNLQKTLYELGAQVIEVDGVPDSQGVSIPFFIEIVNTAP
jgi:hypothetical protein